MTLDSTMWILGDIVSRNSDDEHEILEFNESRYLMLVRCIKPDSGGCFSVGFKEWNLPRRYEWIRRSTEYKSITAEKGRVNDAR